MKRVRHFYLLFLLTFCSQLLITPLTIAEEPIATPDTIILISIDTLRADRLSCYGYEHKTTPNIDALAKESLFFENPFSPVPMTLPSHSSMFTSLIPPSHSVHVNTEYSLPAAALTLPEILKQQGYTTYATVSAVVLDANRGLSQGFDTYDDSINSESGDIPLVSHPDAMRSGDETTERALKWLDKNADKKKFMFIHYFDPHAGYASPPPFNTRFKHPYDAEIAFTDYCVGQILDRLKALNLYDDALIAFVGDHGEMLGEHGEEYHSFFIYNNVLRVPMMFKLPGAVPPKKVKEMTSLIDVAPTILSAANLEVPEVMQGVDLTNYLRSDFSLPDRAIYSESMTPTTLNCSSLLGLSMGRWHYIQSTRPELYDWVKDPGETNNLLEEYPEQALKMKEYLKGILAESESINTDTSVELDAQALEQLASLGYIGEEISVDYSFEEGEEDAKDMIDVIINLEKTVRFAQSGKGDQAIKICTDIIEQYPKASLAYKKLVSVYTTLEEDDKAVEVLEEMIKLFPEDLINVRYLADIHILRDDYPSALARLNDFMALKDDDLMVYEMLVDVYMHEKEFDKVIETLNKKLEHYPGDSKVLIELGLLYEGLKDQSNAMTSYLNALELNPEDNTARIRVANLYFKMQDLEQALYYFEQTLALDPNLPSIHGMVAMIQVDRSNPRVYDPLAALNHAKTAYQLSVDKQTGQCNSPIAYETLAFSWAANGGFEQAIYAAQKAVNLYNAQNLSAQADNMKRRLEGYQQQKQKLIEFQQK